MHINDAITLTKVKQDGEFFLKYGVKIIEMTEKSEYDDIVNGSGTAESKKRKQARF